MIEAEIKVKIKDKKELILRLEQFGFKKADLLRETDVYFDNEAGTFRKSDKALRIRQCENLTKQENVSFVTYKGPKLDNISMTREEVEMKISDGETGLRLFKNLGFSPVLPVIKLRQYLHKENMTACIDQVEGLGDYLELEIIVEEEAKKDAALDRIFELLGELGYDKGDVIRTSYLSLLQNQFRQSE